MTPFEKATLPVNLPDYIADDAVVMNDVYQVNIRRFEAGGLGRIVHLSIKRRDKQACHDWRDFQWIKNQIVGEEFDAVEIYPAESKLVDTSNQYHLWVFLDAKLPFGFQDRMVSEAESAITVWGVSHPRIARPHCLRCKKRIIKNGSR